MYPLFLIILPVVPSNIATALFVALDGPVTFSVIQDITGTATQLVFGLIVAPVAIALVALYN